jgi:hypothetical protein
MNSRTIIVLVLDKMKVEEGLHAVACEENYHDEERGNPKNSTDHLRINHIVDERGISG